MCLFGLHHNLQARVGPFDSGGRPCHDDVVGLIGCGGWYLGSPQVGVALRTPVSRVLSSWEIVRSVAVNVA